MLTMFFRRVPVRCAKSNFTRAGPRRPAVCVCAQVIALGLNDTKAHLRPKGDAAKVAAVAILENIVMVQLS